MIIRQHCDKFGNRNKNKWNVNSNATGLSLSAQVTIFVFVVIIFLLFYFVSKNTRERKKANPSKTQHQFHFCASTCHLSWWGSFGNVVIICFFCSQILIITISCDDTSNASACQINICTGVRINVRHCCMWRDMMWNAIFSLSLGDCCVTNTFNVCLCRC